jgi:hypothetical protein
MRAAAPTHAYSLDKVSLHGDILSGRGSENCLGEQLLLSATPLPSVLRGAQSTSPAPSGAKTSRHAGAR